MASFKWANLNLPDPLAETNEPSAEEVEKARQIIGSL